MTLSLIIFPYKMEKTYELNIKFLKGVLVLLFSNIYFNLIIVQMNIYFFIKKKKLNIIY